MGSDEPDVPDSDGRNYENEFDGNTITDVPIGVHIKEADNNVFTGESTSCTAFLQSMTNLPRVFHPTAPRRCSRKKRHSGKPPDIAGVCSENCRLHYLPDIRVFSIRLLSLGTSFSRVFRSHWIVPRDASR